MITAIHYTRALLLALLLLAPNACDSGETPPILVSVDGSALEPRGTIALTPVENETRLRREVRVVTRGSQPVTIRGIGWARGADGFPQHNPYLSITVGQLPHALPTRQDEFRFTLELSSAAVSDDDLPSTLVITTEYTDDVGTVYTHEFPIIVAVSIVPQVVVPAPVLTPQIITFVQQPGRTQTQTVRLSQRVADGWFQVNKFELETASSELELSSSSRVPTIISATPERHLEVSVSYTAQGNAAMSNAILFHIDTTSTPLRIPITTVAAVESHELTFNDPNAFDFRDVTVTSTRSATLRNIGTVQLGMVRPQIEPSTAANDFQMRYFVEGTDMEITSWPRGLQTGRSVRIEATHVPRAGARDALLRLEMRGDDPEPIVVSIPLRPANL